MWAQFGNSSMSMRGVIVASMLYEFDLENHFFWGVDLIQVQ